MEEPRTDQLWLPSGKITSVKIGFLFSEKRTHNLSTLEQQCISYSDYTALRVSRDLFSAGQHLYEVQDDRRVTTGSLFSHCG